MLENLDTFIEIGSQHKVCEDYIISGFDPVPYIILSDGCSTANNSEMGARILTLLARQYLNYNKDNLHDINYWDLGAWVIHNAEQTSRQLGLSISCLTATLIVSYYIDNYLHIMIYGDGSFLKVYPGMMEITSIEYTNNAPYYLVYLIDKARFKLYDDMKPTKKIITKESNGKVSEESFAYDYAVDLKFMCHNIPAVGVCSDGIDSFIRKEGAVVQYIWANEIAPPFFDYPSRKGVFLQRTMKYVLKNHLKENISHFDDLSLGVYLNTPKE